jgi:hypothetical protein
MPTSITTQPQPPEATPPPANVPFEVEFFMVENADMRCMAYSDQAGQWRNALTHEELTGAVHILE